MTWGVVAVVAIAAIAGGTAIAMHDQEVKTNRAIGKLEANAKAAQDAKEKEARDKQEATTKRRAAFAASVSPRSEGSLGLGAEPNQGRASNMVAGNTRRKQMLGE